LQFDADRRAAVARAGGELERFEEIRAAGQRLRADLLQLGDEIVAGELLAVRSGEPAFEAARRERFDGRARLRGTLRVNKSNRGERKERRGKDFFHDFFAGFLGGAFFSASIAHTSAISPCSSKRRHTIFFPSCVKKGPPS